MNYLGDIRNGNYVHTDINARNSRLKIRDHIGQAQSEWKVAELSVKRIGKDLNKVFKTVVNELHNKLPELG